MPALLHDLIASGYAVTRWHTMPNSRPQNLASHLWGVAMLISRLYDGPPGMFPALMRAALEHDLAEAEIGDMPRPARTQQHRDMELDVANKMHIIHEDHLPPQIRKWLEWADLIEAGLHAQREVKVGNSHFNEVLLRVNDYLEASKESIPPPLWRFAQQAGLVL